MAKKATNGLQVFTYRMNKIERDKADALCKKKYKSSLATFLRDLILNHFPDAKSKTVNVITAHSIQRKSPRKAKD